MNRNHALAALAVAATLALGACGSSGGSHNVTLPGGGNANVKVNGDGSASYSFTGPDGKKYTGTRSKDGTITYTDSQGNKQTYKPGSGSGSGSGGTGSGTIQGPDGSTSYTSGTDLPKDWPKDLDPPKEVTITNSLSTTSGGKKNDLVNATASVGAKDLYDGLKAQITGAGYTVTGDNFFSGSSGDGGTLQATKGTATVNVIITTEAGETHISFTYSTPA